MTNVRTNIGHGQVMNAAGTVCINASAGTTNGAGIDRYAQNARAGKYLSAKLFAKVGAATGSPSAQSVTVTIQQSTDNSTWTSVAAVNVTGDDASGSTAGLAALTADAALAQANVNLKHIARYVRVVVVTAFTAGTSPAIPVCAGLVFVENEA